MLIIYIDPTVLHYLRENAIKIIYNQFPKLKDKIIRVLGMIVEC